MKHSSARFCRTVLYKSCSFQFCCSTAQTNRQLPGNITGQDLVDNSRNSRLGRLNLLTSTKFVHQCVSLGQVKGVNGSQRESTGVKGVNGSQWESMEFNFAILGQMKGSVSKKTRQKMIPINCKHLYAKTEIDNKLENQG